MKTMHRILMGLCLLTAPFTATAQDDDLPQIPQEKLQEIKAQKAAYLTQKMDLSADEAQKFWPVYNEYDKALEAIRMERREAHKAMRDRIDLTESEAATALDRELASQQKELDLRKRFAGEFKKSIGAVKTLKLGRAERDFNRELIKRVRERMQDEGRQRP